MESLINGQHNDKGEATDELLLECNVRSTGAQTTKLSIDCGHQDYSIETVTLMRKREYHCAIVCQQDNAVYGTLGHRSAC